MAEFVIVFTIDSFHYKIFELNVNLRLTGLFLLWKGRARFDRLKREFGSLRHDGIPDIYRFSLIAPYGEPFSLLSVSPARGYKFFRLIKSTGDHLPFKANYVRPLFYRFLHFLSILPNNLILLKERVIFHPFGHNL